MFKTLKRLNCILVNQKIKTLSKKRDIHNFERKIDHSFAQIQQKFSSTNIELLEKYYKAMIQDGIKISTRYRELSMVVRLSNKILRCKKCSFQNKEWNDVTKQDIDDFVIDLMERYSDDGAETEYTRDHKKTLKSFFRWTKYGFRSKEDCINEHGVGDPPETRHVKKKNPDSKLRASDLITDQEREWLLDACDHPMDAFLIDVPLDAGLRPGEIFNVTIGDIKQDKYGFKMDVEGKTGIRPVRLVKSTPTIAKWLNSTHSKKIEIHLS